MRSVCMSATRTLPPFLPAGDPWEAENRVLSVYDNVGFVKAIFTTLGRKNRVEKRRCGEAGVKGAFFAFISTLDTGLPTSTIGWG